MDEKEIEQAIEFLRRVKPEHGVVIITNDEGMMEVMALRTSSKDRFLIALGLLETVTQTPMCSVDEALQ